MIIFSSSVLISLMAAYNVVVFPLPVGPVTRTMPYGSVMARRKRCRSRGLKPNRSSRRSETPAVIASLSRIRTTTASPNTLGKIDTRKSTVLRSIRSRNRPSCGIRRSAMSSSDITFRREISGACNFVSSGSSAGMRMPSIRTLTRTPRSVDSI